MPEECEVYLIFGQNEGNIMNPFETVKWGKEDKIYELGISLDAK
jgi:hypothetical protein